MKHCLTRTILIALAFPPAVAFAGGIPDLGDPHLQTLPRTGAEAAGVAEAVRLSAAAAMEPDEALSAGAATLRGHAGRDTFSQPSPNLGTAGLTDFALGNVLFRKLWVAAPSEIKGSDGLGPLYNSRSCEACHRRDGRGLLPEDGKRTPGLLLKLARPGGAAPQGIPDYRPTLPDPAFGRQLQDGAAPGLVAEGWIAITYDELPVTLADGTVERLRKPGYDIADPSPAASEPGLMISARIAPPMIGLGLIEAIPAADILAHADPLDADGDGISGRPNVVPSAEFGQPMLGRFGWKAGQPTIRAQTAAALSLDMGLSNLLHPDPWGDCTERQEACRAGPHGQEEPGVRDGLELDGAGLDLLTFYARNLAVPERRGADRPEVLAGKQVFAAAGCPACHVPKFVTARLTDRPEQSFRLIWPYSDLLLHDMGEGLADSYPEALAEGREWRTAPLWGLGLTGTVGGRSSFLHDGRARTILEAILWHGGEAAAARDHVVRLSGADRNNLLSFLGSL